MFSVPEEQCSWVLLPLTFPPPPLAHMQPLQPVCPSPKVSDWTGLVGARQVLSSALQKGFCLLRGQDKNNVQYSQNKGPVRQCCISDAIHHQGIILRSNKGHFKEVKSLTRYIENLRHFKDLWKHFIWELLGSFSLAWLWGPRESWLNCLGQTEQILSSL